MNRISRAGTVLLLTFFSVLIGCGGRAYPYDWEMFQALNKCGGKDQACFEQLLGEPVEYGHLTQKPHIRYATFKGLGKVEVTPEWTPTQNGNEWNPWHSITEACYMDVFFEDGVQIDIAFEGEACEKLRWHLENSSGNFTDNLQRGIRAYEENFSEE